MPKTAPTSYPAVNSSETFIERPILMATLKNINQQMNHIYKYGTRVLVRECWDVDLDEGVADYVPVVANPPNAAQPIAVYRIRGAPRFTKVKFTLRVLQTANAAFTYSMELNTAGSALTAGGNVASTSASPVFPAGGVPQEYSGSVTLPGGGTFAELDSMDLVVNITPAVGASVYLYYLLVEEDNSATTLP